jgi:hypothetical protein
MPALVEEEGRGRRGQRVGEEMRIVGEGGELGRGAASGRCASVRGGRRRCACVGEGRHVGEEWHVGEGRHVGRCALVRAGDGNAHVSGRGVASGRSGTSEKGGTSERSLSSGRGASGRVRKGEAAATTEEERREAAIWGKQLSADLQGDGAYIDYRNRPPFVMDSTEEMTPLPSPP